MASDIARIREMESSFDACAEAVGALRAQLDRLKSLREGTAGLFAYYGSEEWYADREGELPEGVKAGVLSEDAVYDMITELRDTAFSMIEMGTDILKSWI